MTKKELKKAIRECCNLACRITFYSGLVAEGWFKYDNIFKEYKVCLGSDVPPVSAFWELTLSDNALLRIESIKRIAK